MARKTKTLAPGDKRRMSDGRNAWRKMTPEQRRDFFAWIVEEGLPVADVPFQKTSAKQFMETVFPELAHRVGG